MPYKTCAPVLAIKTERQKDNKDRDKEKDNRDRYEEKDNKDRETQRHNKDREKVGTKGIDRKGVW